MKLFSACLMVFLFGCKETNHTPNQDAVPVASAETPVVQIVVLPTEEEAYNRCKNLGLAKIQDAYSNDSMCDEDKQLDEVKCQQCYLGCDKKYGTHTERCDAVCERGSCKIVKEFSSHEQCFETKCRELSKSCNHLIHCILLTPEEQTLATQNIQAERASKQDAEAKVSYNKFASCYKDHTRYTMYETKDVNRAWHECRTHINSDCEGNGLCVKKTNELIHNNPPKL